MQQQVMNRNMSSDLGWGIGGEGGWGQQSSAPGSGSWTSTTNQDNQNPGTSWQGINKSDSASDGGDETSSVKSGSAVTNVPAQSQESNNTSTSSTVQASSSSPWSASLPGMDSNPWGSSSSPAPSSIGSIVWSNNPPNLSLPTSQGHSAAGTTIIGSSSAFSTNSSSGAWPTSMSGTVANTMPPNIGGSLQTSSQWQGSSILGSIGDFTKTSDSNWNSAVPSINDSNKENSTTPDPRMWGLSSDKPNDPQWGSGSLATGENGGNSSELSFAQATLKGLKVPAAPNAPQPTLSSRQEEFLRAIENHEGWGSRPIRQDTSWDVETSPKSHRKFSSENASASNVWTNTNGTAIWEAVRESQNNNWGGSASNASTWSGEKDQPNWIAGSKTAQDSSSWNPTNDPKTFGNWGAPGGSGDASASKMWGQKTEVGSWGETGGVQRSTSITSWGDDGDANSWDEQRRVAGAITGIQNLVPPSPGIGAPSGMPTMMSQSMNLSSLPNDAPPWNDGKQGWNPGSVMPMTRPKIDEPWNKPPPARTGWGDPSQDGAKVDDGTSIWAANAPKQLPPQTKPVGWGENVPPNQWSAAPGAKPKAPAGWDEASWTMAQRAKLGRDPDDLSSNSVEVGFWNGIPQDYSTWNDPAALRGVRKISGQMPPKYNGSNSNPPTQMRAKLLQHLMDLGYRKEEAQNALITNNMNLEMAINDLKSSGNALVRKDMDVDVFQSNGTQSRMPYMSKGGLGPEDMSDFRPDQVPSFKSMQNTPFPNAHVQNQPYLQNNTSLPPSSLTPNNSSINSSLQQKLMQKMPQQQQPTPSVNPMVSRGQMPPVGSSGTTNSIPSHQQEQVMAQLRQAVKNGYISWQLLNYPLPHNILVLLQNLLHLQAALQGAIKQQQMLQQARASGKRTNPPIDHGPTIANIQQQIVMVQKQIQQEQLILFSQKPLGLSGPQTGMMTPQLGQQPGANMADNLEALSSDLANVSLQSQSRLATQWKSAQDQPVTTSDGLNQGLGPTGIMNSSNSEEKNDAVKGFLQSSSSPNLNLIPGGLGMTGDRTWSSVPSTSGSGNWPMSSTETNSAQIDSKAGNSSTSSSVLSDVIPEFIPGKPWQGLTKNVEDDPHVTPGSILMQRSLSVNRVHDESLHNLDGHKIGTGNSWSNAGMKSENSLGLSQLGSRPPPSMAPGKPSGMQNWQSNPISRQSSWAGRSGNSAFTQVGSNWTDNRPMPSSWITLKNLGQGIDSSTVRALCNQYGSINNFYYVAHLQLALVQFGTREAAFTALQGLNNFRMGNAIISAEFIGENDAQRLTAQIPPPQPGVAPPMNTSPWSQAPPSAPFQTTGSRMTDPWGNSVFSAQPFSKISSGGSDLWDMTDHNSNLNNILGGETM
ncbi:trinucleotide repeat-containing gene 6c protein [Plakobranchus ocellatus]|uniref:Trinucleotide repeat-containing gene 6c protein n=1 Tax=Plakobranchus ocellatus TaxID=259542 RepID=A0AAV4ABZ1_9GAST|nr:trinucleotide repeat-containing gene 6c protein [Plakobranchus ocellatus]